MDTQRTAERSTFRREEGLDQWTSFCSLPATCKIRVTLIYASQAYCKKLPKRFPALYRRARDILVAKKVKIDSYYSNDAFMALVFLLQSKLQVG